MKTVNLALSEGEAKLLLAILDKSSDAMGNAGCNDMPDEWIGMVSTEEGEFIADVVREDEDDDRPFAHLNDFEVVGYFEDRIRGVLSSK